MNDVKNPANQIHRISGGYYVLWRGMLASGPNGIMRVFESEEEARAYLARCDAAGRMV